MNITKHSPELSTEESTDVQNYQTLKHKTRLVGAKLTIATALACISLAIGVAQSWDLLLEHGKIAALVLLALPLGIMLFVVSRLGRTAEIIWVQKPADLHDLASRAGPKPSNSSLTE